MQTAIKQQSSRDALVERHQMQCAGGCEQPRPAAALRPEAARLLSLHQLRCKSSLYAGLMQMPAFVSPLHDSLFKNARHVTKGIQPSATYLLQRLIAALTIEELGEGLQRRG